MTTTTMDVSDARHDGRPGSLGKTLELECRTSAAKTAVQAAGWIAVGLGIGEFVAPRLFCKWVGAPSSPKLMRVRALRDLTAGFAILTQSRAPGWIWGRVGGEVFDALSLVRPHKEPEHGPLPAALVTAARVTATSLVCAQQLRAPDKSHERSLRFSASTAVNRTPRECYEYWHDIEGLPEFMSHLKSVRVTGDRRSHWIASGPAGMEFSWDAELTEDVPGELIEWRSLDGGIGSYSGSVRFESTRGGRGTIVRLRIIYELPIRAGRSAQSTLLSHDPGLRLRRDLLRFKQLIEAGEIATTEGQPSGRRSGTTSLDRMARV